MVSHPEPHETALSVRRPPSISSRSTTRRHRHNRSHHGGSSSSSYQAQNDFPVFAYTGDVEIVIRTQDGRREQRYLLHRLILSQCSGFFEAGMRQEWAKEGQAEVGAHGRGLARIGEHDAGGSEIARSSVDGGSRDRKRWRYELDWGNREEDIPTLVQKDFSAMTLYGGDHTPRPPPVRNKPPAPQSGFFRSIAGNFSALNVSQQSTQSTSSSDELFRTYDNLFRIFYNYSPALDAVNIANAYVECKTLLTLAYMLDALEVVGPRVDHHLLRFQGRLFKQIAKYPPSYLKLGYLARSKVIFAEALIHVVGQWPAGSQQLRNRIDSAVLELVEDKVDELEEVKAKVEGKLFRLTLTTSRGERVTPSNSWLDWLAMSLFRQWLAENTTPPPAPILKDTSNGRGTSSRASGTAQPSNPHISTGRIYRLLGAGGSSYLGYEELKRFLKLQPEHYNRENMKRFERRVEEVKNLARDVVNPLMRNFLELDLGREGGGLPYLTCTRVEESDFPWDE
ncbi:hypothetical protein BJ546DRAFT_1028215 [Cryomyces antarcticus]